MGVVEALEGRFAVFACGSLKDPEDGLPLDARFLLTLSNLTSLAATGDR